MRRIGLLSAIGHRDTTRAGRGIRCGMPVQGELSRTTTYSATVPLSGGQASWAPRPRPHILHMHHRNGHGLQWRDEGNGAVRASVPRRSPELPLGNPIAPMLTPKRFAHPPAPARPPPRDPRVAKHQCRLWTARTCCGGWRHVRGDKGVETARSQSKSRNAWATPHLRVLWQRA